jgi:hypothetical protein
MNSRTVEISIFNKRDLNGVIPHEQKNWIVIKWFHPEDYETQEQLNDAAENFANEILKDLSLGHFIRVMDVLPIHKEGSLTGYESETAFLASSETAFLASKDTIYINLPNKKI